MFSWTIDKQGSLAPTSSAAERISFPFYLTCSSGSQQTVKGHKTAGRKACKYLNHYLSQGPSLSFTASHQDRMQSGNRVVPSPQTAHTNTHIHIHTCTTSIPYSTKPDRAQLQIPKKKKKHMTKKPHFILFVLMKIPSLQQRLHRRRNIKRQIFHIKHKRILATVTVQCFSQIRSRRDCPACKHEYNLQDKFNSVTEFICWANKSL